MKLRLSPAPKRAASAIEYGLIAASIAVVAVVAIATTGGNLNTVFGKIGTSINTANGS